MAGSSVSVRVQWRGAPEEPGRLSLALEKLARDFAAHWQNNIVAVGSVDTGAYLNSVTSEQQDGHTWIVQDGVEYGVYNEYGTHKMPARPAAQPALAVIQQAAPQVFRGLFG